MRRRVYGSCLIETIIGVLESMPVQSAILYGSYADGTQTDNRDIDLIVSVDDSLKGLLFYELLDKLVVATGKDVDLIESSEVDPYSTLYRDIKEKGQLIYIRS